ncbi:MAG: EAL domain-containing protein [Eubacteriales bacterium]
MKKGKKYVVAIVFMLTLLVAYGVSAVAYAASTMAPDTSNGFMDILSNLSLDDSVPLRVVIPLIIAITLIFILLVAFNGKLHNKARRGGGAYSSQIVQSIVDPIIGLNKNGNITFINSAVLDLFEVKEQEILGKKLHNVVCFKTSGTKCTDAQCPAKDTLRTEFPSTVKGIATGGNFSSCVAYEVAKARKGVTVKNLPLKIATESGKELTMNMTISPIDKSDMDKGMIVFLRDVTEEAKNEIRLQYLATHDHLTTLLNRDGLITGMKSLDISSNQYGVMTLTIQNIKETKDIYGQTAFDDCIKIFATILKEYSPNNALVAKTGDGDFMVVMPYTVETQIENAARKFIKQASLIRGGIYNLMISAGIAYAPLNSASIDEIIMYSEIANSNAPKIGKNELCIFDQKMVDDIVEEHRWENEIEKAFYDNEFILYYQPIVDFKKEKIAKLEALARWNHPEKGILSPWYFINRIERMSIVHEFAYMVIEAVFKDYNDFIKTRYCVNNPISISINVSPQQLFDDEFTTVLAQLMKRYNIPRGVINIEVTESFFEGDFTRSLKVVQEIKEAGCLISMDDFGTEYSTLSKLHTISFDEIKLDKSFVDNIMTSAISLSITKMLVEISTKNNYELVAEGVETEDQLRLLTEYGCNLFQGYYFYKPISKNDIMYIFNSTI